MEAGTRGPEEIKRKEVELGSHSLMDWLAADKSPEQGGGAGLS